MTSFGWKRKSGELVSKRKSAAFEEDSKDEDADVASGEVDWLSLEPKRKAICLEDAIIKSKRLTTEGSKLADAERYWEALKKWEEALQFVPNNAKLYEMKAQVYMLLSEVFPAVHAAQKAVELDPRWWLAYQTLGRAQLGSGEVKQAVLSFSRAVHINPEPIDLWEEDLKWAWSLLQRKKRMQELKEAAVDAVDRENKTKIVELDNEEEEDPCSSLEVFQSNIHSDIHGTDYSKEPERTGNVDYVPSNYVRLRDK